MASYREVTMFVSELRARDIVRMQFGGSYITTKLTEKPERVRVEGNKVDNAWVLRYMMVDGDFNSTNGVERTCVVEEVGQPALRAYVKVHDHVT
jgi:hypothetical protein